MQRQLLIQGKAEATQQGKEVIYGLPTFHDPMWAVHILTLSFGTVGQQFRDREAH